MERQHDDGYPDEVVPFEGRRGRVLQRGVGQLHEVVLVLGDCSVRFANGEHKGDAARTETHLRTEQVREDLVPDPGRVAERGERGDVVAEKRTLQRLYPEAFAPGVENARAAEG